MTAGPAAAGVSLGSGEVAYVDADWLRPPGARYEAAIVLSAGALRFGRGAPVALPAGLPPDEAAAQALLAVAREAAAAAAGKSTVEVPGGGLVAAAVRELLGDAVVEPDGEQRPSATVESSGEPESILGALVRLADLGVLVLAGPAPAQGLRIDLYPDLHRRGLEIVGVAPPLHDGLPPPLDDADPLARLALLPPAEAEQGTVPPPGAVWYRFVPSGA